VLIITRESPPAIGPHPIRVAKLAKYLPSYGWEATLLTVPVDHAWATDDSLATDLGETEVIRVPRLFVRLVAPTALAGSATAGAALPTGRHVPRTRARSRLSAKVLLPDRDILWTIPAAPHAVRLARRFDAILTTAPPFSTHLAGWWVALRRGIPWVADYRDNWSMNPLFRRGFPAQQVNRWLEARCLARADAVTTVSEAGRDEIVAAFPRTAGRVLIAPNGFDPDDLPPPAGRPDAFEIAYAGTLDERRDPGTFLAAVRLLAQERPGFRAAVRLRFMGNISPSVAEAAVATVGRDQAAIDGFLPHREALARASSAAVLLDGVDIAGAAGLTSKIFEYLGLRRPILLLAPPGPARELIRDLGAGRSAEPGDVRSVAAALGGLFDDWQTGREHTAPPERLEAFTRRATAQRVAAALDAAIGRRTR
jgi:glycosyltransferase involved in cell wall biosynthesis